jgi:hypothetical protein
MKKLLFGLSLIALAYASHLYLDHKQSQSAKTDTSAAKEIYNNQNAYNNMSLLINKAESLEHIEIIESLMPDLSKQNREKLAPYISLKKASLLFNQGEYYLRRAGEIESSVAEPKQPPMISDDPENHQGVEQLPSPQPQQYHPLTVEMVKKAVDFYERARKEADKLTESVDVDFNFGLNYLKGEIYYRHLELLADNDTAQELFNQTLNYYKLALRYKPGDIDTVVNVELLIKNQSNLLADANNPQVKRKQMLNVRKAGLGSGRGN